MRNLLEKVLLLGKLVKFEHTIFAIPFALVGLLLASPGWPPWQTLGWVLLAMVGARTGAMAVNRLADSAIDARNPRTAGRPLPSGRMGRPTVMAVIAASFGLLGLAAGMLNPLCLALSPLAMAWVSAYSLAKRFTAFSHLWLGASLALAPVGGWLAVTGSFALPPLAVAAAVLFWVAGFDILYALQDLEFDRQAGLHSIPVRLGVSGSLRISRICSVIMIALLIVVHLLLHAGPFFLAGVVLTAALLAYEQWLLRDGDLSRLDMAFFTMNGYISIIIFTATLLALLTGGLRG
jgi:4-hydroxybenzoate polyprenyltransferase